MSSRERAVKQHVQPDRWLAFARRGRSTRALGRILSRRRVPFNVAGLVKRNTSGRCFICAFLEGTPDYEHVLVCQTGTAIAFLNKYPTLFGYVIVAPKEHREQVT